MSKTRRKDKRKRKRRPSVPSSGIEACLHHSTREDKRDGKKQKQTNEQTIQGSLEKQW
jgi:hypothetical protein